MARRRVNTTKHEIVQAAMKAFVEQGYSATSIRSIAAELDVNPGLMIYYFPTKEHLLAELVEMLCDFQWKLMEREADEGYSSVMAICLELTSIASACESDPIIKDFFLSSYSSPMCLDIIRKNDEERAKKVFAKYCPDWTDEQYAEAEALCSGIEYATLMTVGTPVALETRITGALESILGIYKIPEELIRQKINKVFSMDYKSLGKRVFADFRSYVESSSKHMFE